CANLHDGWLLLLVVVDDNHTLAPRCREREPSTPSAFGRMAIDKAEFDQFTAGRGAGPRNNPLLMEIIARRLR
ncbi:MAG: hypothetical protein ACYTBS_25160, partial [Planctomycetota bacterium]